MAIADIPVQEIIANIRRRSIHPVIENRTLAYVEVELADLVRMGGLGFPVELIGHFAPELGWIVQGLRVHFLVLVHGPDVRLVGYRLVGRVDVVRHCAREFVLDFYFNILSDK